eukprot:276689-Prorocentrum_minimum.AAC.1
MNAFVAPRANVSRRANVPPPPALRALFSLMPVAAVVAFVFGADGRGLPILSAQCALHFKPRASHGCSQAPPASPL